MLEKVKRKNFKCMYKIVNLVELEKTIKYY